MNWQLFASTFALIFLAELPDKTAVAIVVMAARNRASAIFAGAALAFLIQSVVAVTFGRAFSYLPEQSVRIASGILFLVFAGLALRKEEDEAGPEKRLQKGFFAAFRLSFLTIFIAEWGDLTQLATATLVARTHESWTIFTAATLSLWSATAIGCFAGHHIGKKIPVRPLQIASSVLFALVGVWMIASALDIFKFR